jgi:Oxidoreductase family, NAD-binding Rossmann fold
MLDEVVVSRIDNSSSRRSFFASLAGASLASSLAFGANARIRVGVIGCGARGKYLIGNLPENVRVTSICDCARSRIDETLAPRGGFVKVLERFNQYDAQSASRHQDYRRLLDEKSIDAVMIATPDHHHVPAAILACQAGHDVYVEKPLSLRLNESRKLVEIAKHEKRVVQVGSQQRSMEVNVLGCRFIRDGGLGKISKVELPAYPGPMKLDQLARESFGPIPNNVEPSSDSIDWKLFLGATEPIPYDARIWMKEDFKIGSLLWRGWDLFQNFSGHLMTNWGAHSVDMVQLALGRDHTGPVAIEAHQPTSVMDLAKNWSVKTPPPLTDHLANDDERRFWPVTMRYADGLELQFTNGLDSIIFHGERGRMTMRRNFFSSDPPDLVQESLGAEATAKWNGDGNVARPHIENWLDCILSRANPVAALEAGHRTVTICQLANLARELNRPLIWNPERELLAETR